MKKTIIVTGGIGFIGTNLCKTLCQEGHTVLAVDNLYSSISENLLYLKKFPNFRFVKWDIRNTFPSDDFGLNRVDEIYNLACPASPPIYQRNPIFTLETNFLGMMNVLYFAKYHKAKVVQASTSEIYGDPLEHPQVESYRGNVNSVNIRACYDEGKRVAETLCFEFAEKYGVDVKIARIFNTYGPHFNPNDGRVVSNIISQFLTNKKVTIYGDGEQTRSFCYIDDLVLGLMSLMGADGFLVANLGNPREITINELVEMIGRQIPWSTSEIGHLELPIDDPCKRKPEITVAKTVLGWQPLVQLEDGLASTITYFINLFSTRGLAGT